MKFSIPFLKIQVSVECRAIGEKAQEQAPYYPLSAVEQARASRAKTRQAIRQRQIEELEKSISPLETAA